MLGEGARRSSLVKRVLGNAMFKHYGKCLLFCKNPQDIQDS